MLILWKERYPDGYRKIKFFGLTVFKYKNTSCKNKLVNRGLNNIINIPKNARIDISVNGNDNKIVVENNLDIHSHLHIVIHGDNNIVNINKIYGKLRIVVGANGQLPVRNCVVSVGNGCSFSDWAEIVLFERDTYFEMGDDCMVGPRVMIRCSDGHSVLSEAGKVLNRASGVRIGNHVWIGQDCLISKNSEIPDNCIVGARAVVTKKITKRNCILAGIPASVVKENIRWERTPPDRMA